MYFFFADPLDDHDRGALDPFFYGDDLFPSLTMKTVIDEQSIFLFYVSQFYFRDRQGHKLLAKKNSAIATVQGEKRDLLATIADLASATDDPIIRGKLEQILITNGADV